MRETEEEFVAEVISIRDELMALVGAHSDLESVISRNLNQLVGDA